MATENARTWVLVMNGARARILRGIARSDARSPVELVMKSEARNLRDILTDRPRQTVAPADGGRVAWSRPSDDPLLRDQRDFILQVIALLESHRRAGEVGHLVVFAHPDMLHALRALMPPSLQDKVQREVPRNLAHLAAPDLLAEVLRCVDQGTDPT